MSIPVIDLRGFLDADDIRRTAIARTIDQACREVGFFSVIGHRVPDETIRDAHDAALAFFDLPLAERMTAAKPSPTYPYGYAPMATEALNRSIGGSTTPDLKEAYTVGPPSDSSRPYDEISDPTERDVWAPTLWPDAMPELQPAMEQYYAGMSTMAHTLMEAFALALGLPVSWFEPFIDRHASALRLAHYPELDEPPQPGTFRAGAHTDYGTLTILRLDAEPGLQVQSSSGAWIDVDAPDGALVVNLGDLMQRWTNDRWRSTMHRVVVPDGRHSARRLTMPFFHNANWDARIETIVHDGERSHHEPILAGEHLMEKFRSTVS